MQKLAIVVNSFDGYKDLWDSFFLIMSKNYANCTFPIYLITNHEQYPQSNINSICTGDEIDWMHRTKKAIAEIKEEYILFMLEDYFIGKKVDEEQIKEIISYMEINHIDYYRLLDLPKSLGEFDSKKPFLGKISSKQKYGVNTICSIWKKEYLLNIIESTKNAKSAWDFEVALCDYFDREDEHVLTNACVDKRDILSIKNGVYRGKWFRSTLHFFRKNGVKIDTGNRGIMSNCETLKYNCIKFIDSKLSVYGKESVKLFLRKAGFSFLSDKKGSDCND